MQPGTRVSPIPLGSSQRYPSRLGSLCHAEADEVPELDQLSRDCVVLFRGSEGPVQRDQIVRGWAGQDTVFLERDTMPVAAATGLLLSPRALDENPPHGLGGGSEEVTAAVPLLRPRLVDEPDVRLVDQRRGLERLAGLLLGQFLGGQLP